MTTRLNPLHTRGSHLSQGIQQYCQHENDNRTGRAHKDFSIFWMLPIELWIEIFLQCLPSEPRFMPTEAPILLTHICSAWRNVVVSVPQLWCSFTMEIPFSGRGTSEKYILESTALWLQRSRKAPLCIRLQYLPDPSIVFPGPRHTISRIPERILSLLIPHTQRWRHAEFLMPSACLAPLQELLTPPMSATAASFPALRSLTVDLKGVWYSAVPFDVGSLRVDWSQLTELHLNLDYNHLLTLDECAGILREAKRLTRCYMNADCVLNDNFLPQSAGQIIRSTELKYLYLVLQGGAGGGGAWMTETPDACLVAFFDMLILPELRSLELEWMTEGDNNDWGKTSQSGFLTFLSHFSKSLEVFNLAYFPLTENQILECLEHLSHLKELELLFPLGYTENDPLSEYLLGALRLTLAAPLPSSLLPHLTSVKLQSDGRRLTDSSIVDLIESRRHLPSFIHQKHVLAELKRFHLISLQSVTENLRRGLKRWREDGMDVQIICISP